MDKFQNTYRIPTNRLQGWDYSADGCYYITICTQNRRHYFGKIINSYNVEGDNYPSLQPTEIGKIAEKFWLEIPQHFPFVILDEFVIMPNHIHGVLFFNKNNTTRPEWQPNKFGRQSQNLGSVIRGFKSSLKRYANENNIDFAWQSRYYDHIIRNNHGLENVRNYILKNPMHWANNEHNCKDG